MLVSSTNLAIINSNHCQVNNINTIQSMKKPKTQAQKQNESIFDCLNLDSNKKQSERAIQQAETSLEEPPDMRRIVLPKPRAQSSQSGSPKQQSTQLSPAPLKKAFRPLKKIIAKVCSKFDGLGKKAANYLKSIINGKQSLHYYVKLLIYIIQIDKKLKNEFVGQFLNELNVQATSSKLKLLEQFHKYSSLYIKQKRLIHLWKINKKQRPATISYSGRKLRRVGREQIEQRQREQDEIKRCVNRRQRYNLLCAQIPNFQKQAENWVSEWIKNQLKNQVNSE